MDLEVGKIKELEEETEKRVSRPPSRNRAVQMAAKKMAAAAAAVATTVRMMINPPPKMNFGRINTGWEWGLFC
jgi:hypothetical protein